MVSIIFFIYLFIKDVSNVNLKFFKENVKVQIFPNTFKIQKKNVDHTLGSVQFNYHCISGYGPFWQVAIFILKILFTGFYNSKGNFFFVK